MADLNHPEASVVLSRLDIEKDEQRLVIKRKHHRLLELAEEERNVLADITASEEHIERLDAEMEQQRQRLAESEDT